MPVSLITCTGGRPEAFALLEQWIAGQTYQGELDWIVVDDCDPPTCCTMGQTVIRPRPRWSPGQCTMPRNLIEGLEAAQHEKILFIEDDEAYLPGYVADMVTLLDMAQLAGEIPAHYYHVVKRQYREINNHRHASLCQTGIRRELRTRVKALAERAQPFIDVKLWDPVAASLLVTASNVVSIKGMPGRPGIGAGHRARASWAKDPDLRKLASWLGEEGAAKYERFGRPA